MVDSPGQVSLYFNAGSNFAGTGSYGISNFGFNAILPTASSTVSFSIVPEPGTVAMGLMAGAGLLLRRRK
jgi:hypothetical protein